MTGDRIELVSPDNCATGACGFVGSDDAAAVIKAAATTQGIYLYIEVQDNTWVDRATPDACCDDSADLYLDEMDANAIFTCTSCLIGLYSSSLTYTTNQVQVSMGATAPPVDFRYAYYDNNLWSWQTMNLTWSQAHQLYNFDAEVITVDATHKTQEWFVPWEKLGDGIEVGTSLNGKRIGFAGGYNDKDGDNPNPDKLRWPETGDPWAADALTVNYWGDLLLPADMGMVEAVSVREPLRAARGALKTAPAATARYSLTGRRVEGAGAHAGVLVERLSRGATTVQSRLNCLVR
jgi:hypothetical protein